MGSANFSRHSGGSHWPGGRSKGETSRRRVLRSADVTVTTRSLLGQHRGVDVVSVADVDTADHDDDDTYFIPFGSRRRRGDKCMRLVQPPRRVTVCG